MKTVLIRLPNWVGDVIMALPSIHALQQSGFSLHLIGKPWIHPLLQGLSLPLYSIQSDWKRNIALLSSLPSQKMLLFTNSFSSALTALLAGKKAIGFRKDARTLLLHRSLAKPYGVHESKAFLRVAHFACQHWFSEQLLFPSLTSAFLPIHPSHLATIQELLQKKGIQKPFWVLCPFAQGKGKHHASKIWPYWDALTKALPHHTFLVCPTPSEEALCQYLVPQAIVLPQLHLGEYAALLSQAEGVLANDSGPMHIAAAVGAPVTGIFGVSDPWRTSPLGGNYLGSDKGWPCLEEVIAAITPSL